MLWEFMTACRNLFLIYGPWYCSIFLPFSLSGCLICSFAELQVTWMWTSFPQVKYSLKTGGSRLCVCIQDLRFVHFLCFEHWEGSDDYINHVCVSCSVSGTISLEICFAVLEFAPCMHYMHFHTFQSHKESLSICMQNKYCTCYYFQLCIGQYCMNLLVCLIVLLDVQYVL